MKLSASVFIILAAAYAPLPLAAQSAAAPPKVVKITLHPMAESLPALKYQLLPSILDCRPGNAAVLWNRIPAERQVFFNELNKTGGSWERIEKWMEIPLGDAREKQLRDERVNQRTIALVIGDMPYADMARAARFESCDWQLPIHEGNVFTILLPELQQLRTYARLLAAKAHLEIAEGSYNQAVETLQTGFALARDAAKGPTLIHSLVASACAALMSEQIEQLMRQPDAPNLYWALTALPQPLIDFRPGCEAESNGLFLQFPELADLDKKDLAPEEWTKLLQKTLKGIMGFQGPNEFSGTPVELATAAMAVQGYPVAKQYLIDHGRRAAEVEAMPVAKAVLLYSVERYQELCDETFKAMFLPYADGKKWLEQSEKALKLSVGRHEEIIPIAALLLPAVVKAKTTEARTQWVVARLRIFEALRMYAAAHDGTLPDKLEDIAEVPIPRNPFDDKPFQYHREGNRAMLDCADGPPNVPWRYEITMLPQGEKP
jgi:hypothetical protein